MESKHKYVDRIFHYTGKWGMPSLCGLSILEKDQEILVILTELYEENPGSSVTGMVEKVAGEVVREYGINPERAVFIIHNPERSSRYEFFAETFYRATLEWDGEGYRNPEWIKIEASSITYDSGNTEKSL